MNNTRNEKIVSNMIWRFMERCGAQGVTFIVSLVLARLLDPSTYGTVALVTVFITILQVFVDSGMANALIQKEKVDDLDFSTVFFFNLGMCIALYVIMFLAAPVIATFYGIDDLVPIIRVLSIVIIVSGVKNVQQAYVSRNMLFKKFFFSTLGGTLGAALIGIALAYKGFGVWALVAQHLFNTLIDTAILWITVKWRPRFVFSFSRLKVLFNYGWKLLASGLINTIYTELRQLLIGKLYTTSDLAYYNQGKKIPGYLASNINNAIDSVLLPTMSKEQRYRETVKNMTRRAVKISTYVMMPIMMGIAVCANSLVQLVLSDKWMPCVPYIQLCCFTYSFYIIHTANLNAIKALGRSDLFLKLEIIKKVVGLSILLFSIRFGVFVMACFGVIESIISQIINAWPNSKLLKYNYLEQIKDIIPNMLLTVMMGAIVYSVNFLSLGSVKTLLIQIPLGVIVYIILSITFKIDSYYYVLNTIRNFRNKA